MIALAVALRDSRPHRVVRRALEFRRLDPRARVRRRVERRRRGGGAARRRAEPAVAPLQWRHLADSPPRCLPPSPGSSAGTDLIVGAGLQLAAASVASASVAEWRDVPYASVAFCPCIIPSGAAPPPGLVQTQTLPRGSTACSGSSAGRSADFGLRGRSTAAARRSAWSRSTARSGISLRLAAMIVAADPASRAARRRCPAARRGDRCAGSSMSRPSSTRASPPSSTWILRPSSSVSAAWSRRARPSWRLTPSTPSAPSGEA